jgi:virulence-associated protein VagC
VISEVFKSGNSLALRLPEELHPCEGKMNIEASGNCWIVSPVKKRTSWPKGFFARIKLSDADAFQRPSRGEFKART